MSHRCKHRKIEAGHKLGAKGRWEHRAEAKEASNIARRVIDRSIGNGCEEIAQEEYQYRINTVL